jgi:hypothetical protein
MYWLFMYTVIRSQKICYSHFLKDGIYSHTVSTSVHSRASVFTDLVSAVYHSTKKM